MVEGWRGLAQVSEIGSERRPAPSFGAAEETLARMQAGDEVIYRGVLIDRETQTFGEPDLLVRSDVLNRFFPGEISAEDAAVWAPLFGSPWHYRVVDIKFTTLRLSIRGNLRLEGSAPAFRAQLFIYNRALGRLQNY